MPEPQEREQEVALLEAAPAGAADGGSLVLVEGPSGSGKPRLVATRASWPAGTGYAS